MVPFDDDSEHSSFFNEDATHTPTSDSFQNSDNAANVQQWPGDEWAFFGDGEVEHDTELWIAVASIEAIGPNRPPDALQTDEIGDWWEGYDDPIISDAEWSGPIQPNAPPATFDEAWDFDSEQALESSANTDSYQNSDVVVPATSPYDDAWDWDTESTLEDALDLEQPLGADLAGPATPDDPWEWESEEDYELLVIDEANFELDPPQADPWDWDSEYGIDDSFETDQAVGASLPPAPPFDDAWDWEGDSALEDSVDTEQTLGVSVAPTQVFDDPWDFESESGLDDLPDFDQPIGADFIVPPSQPPADPEWLDENVGDDYESTLDAVLGADVVIPPSQLFDDPWDFESESGLEDVLDVEQTLGANVIAPAFDDAWDWDSDTVEDSPDFEATTAPDVATILSPADIEPDFAEGIEDEWQLYVDESANVNAQIGPGFKRFLVAPYIRRTVLQPPLERRFFVTAPNQIVQAQQLAGSNRPYEFDVSLVAVAPWKANASVAANAVIRPTKCDGTGFVYQNGASAGQSGRNEPGWPTTVGSTVVDGSLTLTATVPPAPGEDLIASATWTQVNPPDGTLTITSESNTNLVATALIGGGTSGNVYTVLISITMASGAIYLTQLFLTIL